MNLLPHLITAVVFMAIGMIWGMYIADEYYEERFKDENDEDYENY